MESSFSMSSRFDIKSEDKLLLACSQTKISTETTANIRSLVHRNLDWDYLIKIASKNNLKPLFYSQINTTCPDIVPNFFLGKLRDDFNGNVKKNLLLFGELLRLVDIFNKSKLRVIPYKGPLLSIMAYNDLTLREFGDLDIYIDLEDFNQVMDILQKEGYKSILDLNDSQKAAYFKYQREYMFINKSNGVLVEIKWKLPTPSLVLNIDPKFLFKFEEQIQVKIGTKEIHTLSPDNLLIVLAIHNAGHFWTRLLWLCDISELIKSHELNWTNILENAEKLGIKRVLYINLFLAKDLFDINLPIEVLEVIKDDKILPEIVERIKKRYFTINDSTYGDNALTPRFYEKIALRVKIRERRKNKIQDILSLMFNPTRGLIKNISLPLFLFPMYYIFRLRELVQRYLIDPL